MTVIIFIDDKNDEIENDDVKHETSMRMIVLRNEYLFDRVWPLRVHVISVMISRTPKIYDKYSLG